MNAVGEVDVERVRRHNKAARRHLKTGAVEQALEILDDELTWVFGSERVTPLKLRVKAAALIGDYRTAVADGLEVLAAAPEQGYDFVESLLVRLRLIGEWDTVETVIRAQRELHPELETLVKTYEDNGASLTDRRVLIRLIGGEPYEAEDGTSVDFGAPEASRSDERLLHLDLELARDPRNADARWNRLIAATGAESPEGKVTLAGDAHLLIRRASTAEEIRAIARALEVLGRSVEAAALDSWAGGPLPEVDRRPIDLPAHIERPVVYTVLTGGYDVPRDVAAVIGEVADFVILTDDVSALPTAMQAHGRQLSDSGDSQLLSRRPKMLPHEYFPDHDVSLYIDANFFLLQNPLYFTRYLSEAEPMVVFHHSDRSTPLEEMLEIVPEYTTFAAVVEQVRQMRSDGFDPSTSVLSYGGYLLRSHHEPSVVAAMEFWWEQFQRGVRRDQTSLDYALWKAGLDPRRLSRHNHRNDFWIRMRHG